MSTAVATGMSVTVHRESFLNALNAVAGIVPLKSPKYILQHVKFVSGAEFATGDDGPALFATDLELAIRRLVGGVRVMEPGEMILSPVQLQPIFAKAKCEDLSLYVDGDTIRIRGPKVKYDLQSYDPNSFPDPPQFTSTNYHVVAANNLRKLIRRTQYATCEDTTRYALGGVLTELRPDSIVMVGADGRRLSEAKASAEVVGDPDRFINMAEGEDKQAPVLSLKFMNLLMKTIKDNDPPIHIAVKAQSSVMARTERATIYGRLIEGRFPDYLDMFASSYDAKISLNVGEFRAAIEQAAITRNAETKGVDFSFSSGKLTLAARASDVGSSEVETEIEYDGPDLPVTYDPKFLLEPLGSMGDEVTTTLQISRKAATLLQTEDGFRGLVMPMSRDR